MALSMDEKMRVDELIAAAKDQPSLLNEWERNFLQSQIENMDKYGDRYHLSAKQWASLDKIALRLAL